MPTTSSPGAPIPIGLIPIQEVVAEFGEYDNDNGVRILLQQDQMVFLASHDGQQIEIVVDIIQVLEAIGRHNAKVGS